jgi:hypothetical protein
MDLLVKSLTRSVYQTDVFSIDGHTGKFKIKVTENRDGGKLVGYYFHIVINNVVSNFAKFTYEFSDKRFYWILNTEWFRTWCDQETAALEQKHGLSSTTLGFIEHIAKLRNEARKEVAAKVVAKAVPATKPVPKADVISQVNTKEDVKAIVAALRAGGKKVWFWVGFNPLKTSDPAYASAWERVAGGPTVSEDTAIEWAEEYQGSVFVSTKKSDLWGNVVARGEYYSSIPF